jgi:hypothetical protein
MGKHECNCGHPDRLSHDVHVTQVVRGFLGDEDPCAEWKAYADRCFDYGLQSGKVQAEAENVKAYEAGFEHGVAASQLHQRKQGDDASKSGN